MSATLNAVSITGQIGAGSIVLNDYALNITPLDRGYRLTVTRGSDTQTMDILDGVGIVGIEKTGSTGDVDSYRVTFTDCSTFEYTVETNAASNAAAEAARVEAENSRESAEAARVAAEQSRASAESVRVAAENARVAAETARANAENERAGADAIRAAAETERANAESGRVSAEQGREAAESERVAAEEARAETFAGYDARIDACTPDDSAVDGKPWTSRKIVEALCPPFETTGSIVQCHPVERYPLDVVSRIEPVQAGSGDPSPDNVRPISGRDSVKVTRCGKNLIDINRFDPSVKVSGNSLIGYISGGNAKHAIHEPMIPVSAGMNINLSADYSLGTGRFIVRAYDKNGVLIESNTASGFTYVAFYKGSVAYSPCTFVVSESVKYIQIGLVYMDYDYPTRTESSYTNISAAIGSDDATATNPYTGDTYTAELPETIYGGELDWNTGVLTVTHGQIASYAGETLPGEWISDRDVYAPDATPTTGAQVAYKLAEPYTVQLTPQQIAAFTGINTLYTDSGDTAVSGRADPVWLTQSLMERIAALESAATNV